MSRDYTYTQGDILVGPYKFQKIRKLKIVRELNEHARLFISGIISDKHIDKYVEETGASETIKVAVKEEDNIKTIFEGIVTKIGIKASDDVRTLEIEALSKTFLMDTKKISGTYQNENLTYEELFVQKINCI